MADQSAGNAPYPSSAGPDQAGLTGDSVDSLGMQQVTGWQQPAVRFVLLYLACAGFLIGSAYARLPGNVTLTFLGHSKTFHDFGLMVLRNLIVPALILPLMALVEMVCVGWHDSSLRDWLRYHDRSTRSDLVMFVLVRVTPIFHVISLVLTLGFSEISGDALRVWLLETGHIDLSLARLPLPAMALCYLLVHTFFNYWEHRIQHTRLFWPIHRFHHAAEEFSLVTADRIHPGDFATVFFSVFLVGLFQVSAVVYLGYALVLSVLRFTIHSRIDTDFGWVGRYLVLSPGHHRAHHIADEEKSGGNFGLIPLWDVLFGTLQPAVRRSTPIGVEDRYRHGYWVVFDLLRDTRDFFFNWLGAVRNLARLRA